MLDIYCPFIHPLSDASNRSSMLWVNSKHRWPSVGQLGKEDLKESKTRCGILFASPPMIMTMNRKKKFQKCHIICCLGVALLPEEHMMSLGQFHSTPFWKGEKHPFPGNILELKTHVDVGMGWRSVVANWKALIKVLLSSGTWLLVDFVSVSRKQDQQNGGANSFSDLVVAWIILSRLFSQFFRCSSQLQTICHLLMVIIRVQFSFLVPTFVPMTQMCTHCMSFTMYLQRSMLLEQRRRLMHV